MKKNQKPETRTSRKGRTTQHQALYDKFLQKLVAAREEAGLSQRDVTTLLERPHSFLSKCETGERSVEVFELIQLAQIYNKPPQFFLDPDSPLS